MKRTKIIYWIVTGLFAAFMSFAAISDELSMKDAIEFYNKLGYPSYIITFLDIAKLLGVAGILIPGFPRIKEWAYAGLIFDLTGATYSIIRTNPDPVGIIFMAVAIGFGLASYFLYHKLRKQKGLE
jgi:hypothetical protein